MKFPNFKGIKSLNCSIKREGNLKELCIPMFFLHRRDLELQLFGFYDLLKDF